MSGGSSEFKVNDGSYGVQDSGAWRDLSFTGTLTSLSVKGDDSQTYGNFAPRLSAIRIDGSTILTDPLIVNGAAAATTFNPFNTDINTVMGQETGYVTLNPLRKFGDNCNLSNGNLTATGSSDTYPGVAADIALTSGKWYYEFQIDS